MKDTKITLEEAFKELEESNSSIMLTNDVIGFLKRIQFHPINLDIIKTDIENIIDNYNAVDDISNEEFGISHNEIYIDSCDIDLSRLKSEIREIFDTV